MSEAPVTPWQLVGIGIFAIVVGVLIALAFHVVVAVAIGSAQAMLS
jgi:predicted outer membrane lipoprotein